MFSFVELFLPEELCVFLTDVVLEEDERRLPEVVLPVPTADDDEVVVEVVVEGDDEDVDEDVEEDDEDDVPLSSFLRLKSTTLPLVLLV